MDVRLRGREPEFVVTLPPGDVENDTIETAEGATQTPPAPETEDGGTARLTLRLGLDSAGEPAESDARVEVRARTVSGDGEIVRAS